MKEFLEKEILKYIDNPQYYNFKYNENINEDALTEDWLKNNTSWIYKVAILTAIDSNKCDFVDVIIGTQRHKSSEPKFVGYFTFFDGENHDIPRVIKRIIDLLKINNDVFIDDNEI
jgi:hypothetical protein